MRERFVEVEGRRTRVVEAGAGPTVVLVPGLGLSADFYASVIGALRRARLRVVVPDLPGFGRSRRVGWTGMSPERTAAWLAAMARAAGLERAVWMGHSVSCQPLVELAATEPARVRALVLAAPTGVRGWRGAPYQAVTLPVAGLREPASLLRRLARDYLRTSPLRYGGTWLRAAAHNTIERAHAVSCPVLVVCGRRDPVVPPRAGQRLAAALPRGRLVVCPSGSHGLPVDATDEFVAAASDFVRRLGV